jgi:hypothetical protein
MVSGVLLAIMERLGYILPICSEDGQKVEVNPGTIAAGYQVLQLLEHFSPTFALRLLDFLFSVACTHLPENPEASFFKEQLGANFAPRHQLRA